MFTRFDWFEFDSELHRGDLSDREQKAKRLGNAWSVWTGTSQRYWRHFKRGDQNAITTFAKQAKGALLAPWVITALQRWQAEGTLEAKVRIRRAINAWLDSRGRQRPRDLFALIRRDKQIAIEILTLRRKQKYSVEQAISKVTDRHRLSEETIREIHRRYAAFAKRQFDSVDKALHYLRTADPETIWDRLMAIWDDEGTVFFLEQEISRMKAFGQVSMEDLRPTPPSPGRFIDRLIVSTPSWLTVTVKLTNSTPSSRPPRDGSVGGYVRVDVFERDSRKSVRTKFWEWENGTLVDVPGSSALHNELILRSDSLSMP